MMCFLCGGPGVPVTIESRYTGDFDVLECVDCGAWRTYIIVSVRILCLVAQVSIGV